jgi:hypothetical protein
MPTRVVAPLVVHRAMLKTDGEHPRIAQMLVVQGQGYILNPLDIATIAVSRLGGAVASFASDDDA